MSIEDKMLNKGLMKILTSKEAAMESKAKKSEMLANKNDPKFESSQVFFCKWQMSMEDMKYL